ncbi:DNA alkylation response protein [Aquibium carbonis]|uniref:DNA alkylation response protein n=1 Tax=Aquibium carbonis TaxID=2495581 RepID=A0A3R9Y8S5_9HYPH|nr:acyl-CoA dehydrogenase family protein [Aquibium carbonis]RST86641.1 DNA alkylation response protein [Aquibium carbonis]
MTHEVTNQAPPLAGSNAWRGDPLLVQLSEEFSPVVRKDLDTAGRFAFSAEAQELARLANSEMPRLRTHDRHGRRIDQVEFHPAYHALLRRSVATGLHSSVWENDEAETGRRHQIRATRFYMMAQLESAHLSALSTTSGALAALMASPKLFREWAPRVTTRKYDPAQKPPVEKTGLLIGMGLTEKQGGSDVESISSRAEPAENGFFRLTGHKWFLSAPMCDAFLMLAQAPEGLSCFLVPRILSSAQANGLRIQRLKDKLGNRSTATAEVEFSGAIAERVGAPGAGQKTIMDMVTLSRLDGALSSAGIMRAALAEAIHHARHRRSQGHKLIDKPIMQRVLADLALDVAAATALSLRLARSFDRAAGDRSEAAFARAMTPVVKYWVCKLAPSVVAEAMECYGGNGYVDESPMARLFRDSPASANWEGPGNTLALDMLRVFRQAPSLFADVMGIVERDLGPGGKGTVGVLRAALEVALSDEGSARILAEQLALSTAAAELKRLGAGRIADAFIETRLAGQWRSTYGMLDTRHDSRLILDTLYPETT